MRDTALIGPQGMGYLGLVCDSGRVPQHPHLRSMSPRPLRDLGEGCTPHSLGSDQSSVLGIPSTWRLLFPARKRVARQRLLLVHFDCDSLKHVLYLTLWLLSPILWTPASLLDESSGLNSFRWILKGLPGFPNRHAVLGSRHFGEEADAALKCKDSRAMTPLTDVTFS